jgi:hypothetical protein
MCLSVICILIAVLSGMSTELALATSPTPTPSGGSAQIGVTHVIGDCSLAHRPRILPVGVKVISKTTAANGTLVVYRFHSLEYKVTYLASGKCLYTIVRTVGAVAVTPTPTVTTTVSSATPVPTVAEPTAVSGTTSSGTTVYSPSHPAPVVPSGATTVSQSTTAYGTLVVYQSGGSYYNVTYLPDGRYIYAVTQVPGSSMSTLPTTGGGSPDSPRIPWGPAILAVTLILAAVVVRRVSRMGS